MSTTVPKRVRERYLVHVTIKYHSHGCYITMTGTKLGSQCITYTDMEYDNSTQIYLVKHYSIRRLVLPNTWQLSLMATGAVGTSAASTALALPIVLSSWNIHDNSLDVAVKTKNDSHIKLFVCF